MSELLRLEVRGRVQWYAGYIRRTESQIITIEDEALTPSGYYVRRELTYMFDDTARNPWYLEITQGKMSLLDSYGAPLFRRREIIQSAMWVREKFDFIHYGTYGGFYSDRERRFLWWLDYRFPDSPNDIHRLISARAAVLAQAARSEDTRTALAALQDLNRELALYRLGAPIPRE